MDTPGGSELVQAARAGDADALAVLVEAYLPLVYNIVGRALNGHPDVDDVVQETMFRAVRGLPSLRDPERFRSWLVAIAIRQVREHTRAAGSATARQSSLEQVGEQAARGPDFVDATVLRLGLSGQRREVAEAARWLSPEERHLLALWWHEVGGTITRADLVEALGLRAEHAAVRIQRMKARLDLARRVVRAREARPPCPRLDALARRSGSESGPRLLSRLGRHLRRCERCGATGRALIPPEHLLPGLVLVPPPAALLHDLPGLVSGLAGTAASAATSPDTAHRAMALLGGRPALVTGSVVAGAAALTLTFTVQYLPPSSTGPRRPPGPVPSMQVAPPPATRAPSTAPATGQPSADEGARAVLGVSSADLYVAPDGDDTADGTLARPFASLARAVSVVRPGQTIALRGGTYRPVEPVDVETDGTADRRITVSNYRDELPVIDASGAPGSRPFVRHRGDFWTVQGIEIENAGHDAYVCESCRYGVFRRLVIHDSQGTGFTLRDEGTVGNQVVDSDFHSNHDDAGRGASADGLAVKFGSGTGNVVRGCRFYDNSDDGLETTGFTTPVRVESSWSYGNGVNRWGIDDFGGGGNGFRLAGGEGGAPVGHVVVNSAAWGNTGYGFTESGNTGPIRISRSTAADNGKDGFGLWFSPAELTRNLAVGNARQVRLSDQATESGNSWNENGWTEDSLADRDPAAAEGARAPDGGLPLTRFLTTDEDLGATMTGGTVTDDA